MTHSVNDLASSFVEMAKAYERLPEVENDLTAALHTINNLHDTIASMNRTLIDRTSTIDELNSRIHDLEVSREDAELRFLECDDAKTTLERTLEGLGKDIASALAAVQPLPRAEPAPMVEPTTDASSTDVGTGQSEADPTSATTHPDTANTTPALAGENAAGDGVSVSSDPTPANIVNADGQYHAALPPLPLVSVSSTNEASWPSHYIS